MANPTRYRNQKIPSRRRDILRGRLRVQDPMTSVPWDQLSSHTQEACLEDLLHAGLAHEDSFVRLSAVDALRRGGLVGHLMEVARDQSQRLDVRKAAATALVATADSAAPTFLKALASDPATPCDLRQVLDDAVRVLETPNTAEVRRESLADRIRGMTSNLQVLWKTLEIGAMNQRLAAAALLLRSLNHVPA